MSTILKALRQLEREAPPDSADPFGAVVEPDPTATPARRSKPRRSGSAGIGLGVALAGAGLLLIGLALQPMFRTSTPAVALAASSAAQADPEIAAAPFAPELPVNQRAMPRSSIAIVSRSAASEPDSAPSGQSSGNAATRRVAEAQPFAVVSAVSDEPAQQLIARLAAANAPSVSEPEPEVAVPAPKSEPVMASTAVEKPGPGGGGAVGFVPVTALEVIPEAPVAATKPKPDVVAAAKPAPPAVSTPPKARVALVETSSSETETETEPGRETAAPPLAPRAAESLAVSPVVETAEDALDRAVLDFEEIRRPLDPPVLFPVQTSWHPKPERREARLEAVSGQAQVVREGDEVDGYRVLEISPSAVVFERDGETVRVRVGGR